MLQSFFGTFETMPTRPTTIPAYALYGETDSSDGPCFAHIETIEARSALHNWEIAPHRHHHSNQVLIVSDGAVDVALDGATRRLTGPCCVTVPVGAVHGFRFQPATHGWVLTLAQSYHGRASGSDDPMIGLLTKGSAEPLPPEAAGRVARLADELVILARQPHEPLLFLALAEALVRSLPSRADRSAGRNDSRLAQFRHLAEIHLAEHRPVTFYADSLGVTVRTLNRLCQCELGCTPLELLNGRLASEAQRLLRYTNASVTQVAEALGFADASYFSRFYLRMIGRRPSAEGAATT